MPTNHSKGNFFTILNMMLLSACRIRMSTATCQLPDPNQPDDLFATSACSPQFAILFPYNRGMSHLDILLPFGLPPAHLAPDLLRELKTPALATLIAKA